MLGSLALSILYLLLSTLATIIQLLSITFKNLCSPGIIIAIIFCSMFLIWIMITAILLGGLLSFHVFLIYSGYVPTYLRTYLTQSSHFIIYRLTTHEYLKALRPAKQLHKRFACLQPTMLQPMWATASEPMELLPTIVE